LQNRPAFIRSAVYLAALLASTIFAGDQPAKQPFYFITDYLPPAIYENDGVTGCFRAENTTAAAAKLSFSATAQDENGKTAQEYMRALESPAGAFASCQHTLDSRDVERIQFALKNGSVELGAVNVRILHAGRPWPPTVFRQGRLYAAEGGDALLPCVPRRTRSQERAFGALKWFGESKKSKAESAGHALLLLPGNWQSYPAKDHARVALGPYAPNGAAPILRALADFHDMLRQVPAVPASAGSYPTGMGTPAHTLSVKPQRILICLPPEDLEVATTPRTYRNILDAMLAHCLTLDLKQVVLVPPFQYGCNEKHCVAIWQEVREAAAAYGIQTLDVSEYLNERLWRVDPNNAGVYGKRPNSEGQKLIEEALNAFVSGF